MAESGDDETLPGSTEGPPGSPQARGAVAGRYVVLRSHARGGLGEVFVARDLELERDVALKEMNEVQASNPRSRLRFLEEARVTATLEHPGIVAVHGLGWHPNGRPYYAMRLIRGETMRPAIERLHDPSLVDPQARARALRALVGRFASVCQAVGYAHDQGILHRDLKPDNVMLGPYGETLVVDWGLARRFGAPERSEADADEAPRSPASGGAGTELGVMVGTPGYMSPEQAAGRWDEIGPAADIYSLGAMLSVVLTGRRPGEARPGPGLDRALAAISARAMAAEPARRYPTALDLAADVERWLADEPVSAWREPPLRRLSRWVRRHRTAVAALGVLVLSGAVALGIGNVMLGRANLRIEVERNRANAQFERALRAVDDSFTQVSENTILQSKQPGMRALRRTLLESALTYYREFVQEAGDDASLRAELARAHARAGRIDAELGTVEEARRAFEAADALWRALVAERPDDGSARLELASNATELGRFLFRTVPGEGPRARALLLEAIDSFRRLVERGDAANDTAALAGLGGALDVLSRLELEAGATGEAARLGEEALAAWAQVAQREPRYRRNQAAAALTVGFLQTRTGTVARAQAQFDAALALVEPLARAQPHDLELQKLLSRVHVNIGYLHFLQSRRPPLAREHFLRARDISAHVVAREPDVPEYRVLLADLGRMLSEVSQEMGETERAIAEITAARVALEAGGGEAGGRLYEAITVRVLASEAQARAAGRDWPGALVAAEAGAARVRGLEGFGALEADERRIRIHLVRTSALSHAELGRDAAALTLVEAALPAAEADTSPDDVEPQQISELGRLLSLSADLHRRAGHGERADEHALRGLAAFRRARVRQPTNERYAVHGAVAMERLASDWVAAGRVEEARPLLEEALAAMRTLAAPSTSDRALMGRLQSLVSSLPRPR